MGLPSGIPRAGRLGSWIHRGWSPASPSRPFMMWSAIQDFSVSRRRPGEPGDLWWFLCFLGLRLAILMVYPFGKCHRMIPWSLGASGGRHVPSTNALARNLSLRHLGVLSKRQVPPKASGPSGLKSPTSIARSATLGRTMTGTWDRRCTRTKRGNGQVPIDDWLVFGTWMDLFPIYWIYSQRDYLLSMGWYIYISIWLGIYWEFHHPNWRTHIFQRGRSTTNQMIFSAMNLHLLRN